MTPSKTSIARRDSRPRPSPGHIASSRRHARRQRGYSLVELLMTASVLFMVLSLTLQTILQFRRSYQAQIRLVDTQYNARAATDMIVRLIRVSQTIDPDPDANGVFDSISIIGDWNPPNGSVLDPYETIALTTANGLLLKQEPTDAEPVPFSDEIESLTFTFFDTNGAALADPVAQAAEIALVSVVVTTTAEESAEPLILRTSASVRIRQ